MPRRSRLSCQGGAGSAAKEEQARRLNCQGGGGSAVKEGQAQLPRWRRLNWQGGGGLAAKEEEAWLGREREGRRKREERGDFGVMGGTDPPKMVKSPPRKRKGHPDMKGEWGNKSQRGRGRNPPKHENPSPKSEKIPKTGTLRPGGRPGEKCRECHGPLGHRGQKNAAAAGIGCAREEQQREGGERGEEGMAARKAKRALCGPIGGPAKKLAMAEACG